MGRARYSRHNWVPAFRRDGKFDPLQLIGETSKS
jgi:hypothetical protein